MDFEKEKCPIIQIDGVMATGHQFDLDITLPEDDRSVIYGIIKDKNNCPIRDAAIKLVEVDKVFGKDERKPISHTFTDKNGEFVFGPLCKDRFYEVQIWANNVKKSKICAKCKHEGKCLKGEKLDCK